MSSSSEEEFQFEEENGAASDTKQTAVAEKDKSSDHNHNKDAIQPSPVKSIPKRSKSNRNYAEENNDHDDESDFEPSLKQKKKKAKVKSESVRLPISDDDGSDFDEQQKKKKKTKKKKTQKVKPDPATSSSSSKRKTAPSNGSSASSSAVKRVKKETKPRELKKLGKTERLQYAMQSFLWWDAPEPPEGCQWVKMEHAGVNFPPPYVPHGIKMLYDGKPVDLTPPQEEAATFFASMDPNGMNLGNPKTAPIFTKNFFADFKALLGKGHFIKDLKKCDFEPIRQYLNEQKIIRKAMTDEQRKANK